MLCGQRRPPCPITALIRPLFVKLLRLFATHKTKAEVLVVWVNVGPRRLYHADAIEYALLDTALQSTDPRQTAANIITKSKLHCNRVTCPVSPPQTVKHAHLNLKHSAIIQTQSTRL